MKYFLRLVLALTIGLGIGIGMSLFNRTGAEERMFLEKQGSQAVYRGAIYDTYVTKWYDKDNGYCVYTINGTNGVSISVIKP